MSDDCAPHDMVRDYQPRKLADKFDGLDSSVDRYIAKAIATNRLPRLLALTGPAGCGKGTTARIIARRHCCEHKDRHHYDPCLECDGCRSIDKASGGTWFSAWGYTEFDATRLNGHDIAKYIDKDSLCLSLHGGNRQLFCVDEVMRSRTGVQERLLRLAENSRCSIMICTIEPANLMPELLARFTHLAVRPPTRPQVVAGLQRIATAEGFELRVEAAALVARCYSNNPRNCTRVLGMAMVAADGKAIDVPVIEAVLEIEGHHLEE